MHEYFPDLLHYKSHSRVRISIRGKVHGGVGGEEDDRLAVLEAADETSYTLS